MINNNIRFVDNKYIQLPILKKVEYIKPKNFKNKDRLNKVISGQARILNATISQKGDKFYVSLCCEEIIDLVQSIDLKNIDEMSPTSGRHFIYIFNNN